MATKLVGFSAVVATAFGVAMLVGSAVDPIAPERQRLDLASSHGSGGAVGPAGAMEGVSGHASESAAVPSAGIAPAATSSARSQLPGLAVAARGYALRVEDVTPGSGEGVALRFAIESPDGGPVLNYRPTHEKEMHLIVVRRDLTGFQHLHPERDAAGTWSAAANLTPGIHRIFADFALPAQADPLTLGADVFAPGDFQSADLPKPSTTWAADGYEVSLGGAPRAGAETDLGFTVRKDGRDVSDLEPYLAAFGHLVSLRTGDLAYLHTHPAQEAVAGQRGGPVVQFGTTFPTAGNYRLFLNFSHAGVVRTAEFTVAVGPGSGVPAADTPAPAGELQAPATPLAPLEPAAPGHSGH
ncbi:MAG: hypothetical protein ACT4QF_04835 [Sporichthyaceae bacterium]